MDSDIPLYYRLRFTFPFQKKEHLELQPRDTKICELKMFSDIILDSISGHFTSKLTAGVEFKNSRCENTWTHMHLSFTSTKCRDTIVTAIKRKMEKEGYDPRIYMNGNKCYSLKAIADPRNDMHFFQYPLKQIKSQHANLEWSWKRQLGFTRKQFEDMRLAAYAIWEKAVEINQVKHDKQDTHDTLFERLSGLWDKQMATNDTFPDNAKVALRDVQDFVLQFYTDEQKPYNHTTMRGYAELLAFKHNIITRNELLNRIFN